MTLGYGMKRLPITVSVLITPPPGAIGCPAVTIDWGDGNTQSRVSDCEEDEIAKPKAYFWTYRRGPLEGGKIFLITVTIEQSGITQRAAAIVELP